jgi:hypothetical protein
VVLSIVATRCAIVLEGAGLTVFQPVPSLVCTERLATPDGSVASTVSVSAPATRLEVPTGADVRPVFVNDATSETLGGVLSYGAGGALVGKRMLASVEKALNTFAY